MRDIVLRAIALILLAGFVVLPVATASADTVFVTNLVHGTNSLPIPGNQAWGGQLGDDFMVNQQLVINRIGVFDDDGNGTTKSLTWRLYNVATGDLIHQEVVGASGARTPGTTISDNYVWKDLAVGITLNAATSYSVVAYGFDSNNNNFNTNISPSTTDIEYSTFGLTAYGGRYSAVDDFSGRPDIGPSPANQLSTTSYNFGAATFEYSAVPEPSTCIALLSMGAMGLVSVARRRKKSA